MVVVHRKEELGFYHPGVVPPGDEGAQLLKSESAVADASCQAGVRGLLAPVIDGADAPHGKVTGNMPGHESRFDPKAPIGGAEC